MSDVVGTATPTPTPTPTSTVRSRNWRVLSTPGLITGLTYAVVGFTLGRWLGRLIGRGWPRAANGSDENDLALVLGYVFAVVGWLWGLGFARYPGSRLRGAEPSAYAEERPGDGVRRFFEVTTDHKVVGIQYLIVSLTILLAAGVNAMLIRAQLLNADGRAFNPNEYLTLVGLHGSMMIMTMSAAAVGGFGNYLVPLMIGARRTAFPRIQALALWLLVAGSLVILSSVLVGGFTSGWTGYMPLGDEVQLGMNSYYVAFGLVAITLTLVGLDLFATIVTMRAPGLTWGRLPMFVWGVYATTILMVLAAPMLLGATLLALFDRTIGTVNFVGSMGGSAFLWENLFWFFGHPEVYILALPGFGILLEIIPVFARKTLWGYGLAVSGMLGVAFLSFTVWQHHLFVSGINSDLRPGYSLSTEMISIPTGFIFLCALGTLWKGRIRLTVPMLFCLAFIFNFLVGGVSGVYLSDVPSNATTHGSYFVMAHFHYTIMGGLVFALFAAIYYWLPKMTGLRFREGLAKLHFWTMFLAFNATFLPLFLVGARGMPRRVSTYEPDLRGLNVFVSISAFVLGASMLVFIVNFVVSQFLKREPAEANPWDSRGLEWQLPTPIPPHNFDEIPEVLSAPYEYGDPDAPPVADLRPARPRTHQAGTRITGLHGYPVEDPDPTPNTLMVGARLLTAAGIVFFVTFGFAYVYLKAQNSNGLWNKGEQVSVLFGTATLAAFVVSAAAYLLATLRLRADDMAAWQGLATISLVLGSGAIALHAWQLDTLPFAPADGGYASVYIGWTVALVAAELGAMYWLLTLLRGSLRIVAIEKDLDADGPEPLVTHLVASARGYRMFWSTIVAIEVLTFVLLVLVR
jgi:cytochrome c oxidase subunit 1